jgi:glycosyltransferase involved in cell wall biosynthesis
MRILQVVHGFPPRRTAGTETHASQLSHELARRHDVHVLYPVREGPRFSLRRFTQNNMKLYELTIPYRLVHRIRYGLCFGDSYRNEHVDEIFDGVLSEIEPDVVHFHHLVNLSASLLSVARSKGVPVVLTVHDCWLMCPTANLMMYDRTVCQGPNEDGTKCCHCWNRQRAETISGLLFNHHIPTRLTSKPLERVLSIVNRPKQFKKRNEYMKRLLLEVNMIIFPSRFLVTLLSEQGLSPKRWVYSEHGYDLARFMGFQKARSRSKFVFSYLGGTARHKGIDVLINAFSDLQDDNAELLIYGPCDGGDRRLRELRTKIAGKNMKIMGMVADTVNVYSAADVVIIPSVCQEVASLVAREAMVTRTPVIASDIGGLAEFVRQEHSGLLFEVGNPNDLSRKMRLVMNDPETLHKLKSGIRERAKSIDQQAQELEEIYWGVIREKRSQLSNEVSS